MSSLWSVAPSVLTGHPRVRLGGGFRADGRRGRSARPRSGNSSGYGQASFFWFVDWLLATPTADRLDPTRLAVRCAGSKEYSGNRKKDKQIRISTLPYFCGQCSYTPPSPARILMHHLPFLPSFFHNLRSSPNTRLPKLLRNRHGSR